MFKVNFFAVALCVVVVSLNIGTSAVCDCGTDMKVMTAINRKLVADIASLKAEIAMLKDQPAEEEIQIIDYGGLIAPEIIFCRTTVSNAPNIFKSAVTKVQCPSNCERAGRVWGTSIYTEYSPVCKAAIHAGVLRADFGPVVTVKKLPGQSSYRGSTRNGITTSHHGSWHASYEFCDDNNMQC